MSRALLFLALVPCLLVPAAFARDEDVARETWYAGYFGGKKIGWMHEERSTAVEDGRKVFIYRNESRMTLSRAGTPMVIEDRSETVEDEDGKVLRFENTQKQGPMGMTTKGTVVDGKLHLDQNGRQRTVDYPEGAVGQFAIDRRMREKGFAEGTKLTVPTFSVQAPDRPVTVTIEIGKLEKKDVLGRVVMLHRATMKDDLFGIPLTAWFDDEDEALAIDVNLPFGAFRFFATEKELALAEGEPAEVFTTTLVVPDRAIEKPRELRRLRLRLVKKEGLDGIYEGEGQRVVERTGGAVVLEIGPPPAPEGEKTFVRPVAAEGLERYLEPGPWIQSDDEVVAKLAAEAVGEETDARKVAARIEAYVRRKITKKNLNVGFASAAEVARTLEGDCTEHGVLCCALARAAGLPSRVVTGLVYLSPAESGTPKGIFGYHMWAEVMVAKDVWLPIDAAIGTWDATHIALAKSDLSSVSPELDLVLAILKVLGDLKIEVVKAG